jgi:hypothetical protein
MRPEPRTAEVRAESPAEPRALDPLAGLAAELSRVQPDSRAQQESPAPKMRAPREREMPRELPRARAPQPERARPLVAPPAANEPATSDADQNLAEMAQRLEAALRRPKPTEPRAAEAPVRQSMMPMAAPEPMMAAPDAAPHDDAPPAAPQPRAAAAAAGKPQKSVYDSLEQEMASLLGRPNSKA